MRILIDIKHPAHVHFFSNFIRTMREKGHKILVTARDKEMTLYLLERYGIVYEKISAIGSNKLALPFELIVRNFRFLRIATRFKPDILIELMGVTAAPIARIIGKPCLVFYDTENAKLTNSIAYILSTKFITPESYRKDLGRKNMRYKGYHELAYLHPSYFTPDRKVLKKLDLTGGQRFTVLRFVSWNASHDLMHKGISLETKKKAVDEFLKYGKVFITSEKELPPELEKYRPKLRPEDIHSLLYYSTLLYGESATMASEAAVLGTYAIYLDDEGRGYTDEEEKRYNLIFNFSESEEDQKRSIDKGIAILKSKNPKEEAQKNRKKLLNEKCDVTKFMIQTVLKTIGR